MKKMFGFFLVLIMGMNMYAQDKDVMIMRPAIGLYGGVNINMNTIDIPFFYLPSTGLPFQSSFNENLTSYGYNVGLIGYIPFSDYVVLAPRIGYNTMNAVFNKDYSFTYLNTTYNTKNEYDAKLAYLEITPAVQLHNLLPIKPLYFMLGFELGIPMTNTYTATLNDGVNPASVTEGDIPAKVNTRMAAALGVGALFELSDYVKLGAEVSYRLPLNDVSSFEDKVTYPNGASWKINQLRAGLSLTFDIGGRSDCNMGVVTPAPRETSLDVAMGSINAVNRDGERSSMRSIKVEDLQYTELFPFLPYVFFEENNTEPVGNYQTMSTSNEAGQVTISTLPADAVRINSNTLNIIGERMQQNPNASITITGTIDNRKEKNKSLSSNRAQMAKDYLVKNFNISEGRINVVAAGLPSRPSSASSPEGIAENRRLEITSNDLKIVEPILISGENIRVANPDVIEFSPVITSSDPVSSFKLELFQGGKTLRSIRGDYQPTAIQWAISPNDLANRDMPVEYTLFIRSNDANLEKEIKGTIPVEYVSITKKKEEKLADKTVARYSLTLFDFDKSDVSADDMSIIEKYIVPAIKFNSTVDIYGYTDRIGDDKHNLTLSQKRADAVKKILEGKVSGAKYITHGVGETVTIYDNDSPVGRQLSRTVQVYITTPR